MDSKKALKNFIKTLCEYETDTNNKESVYPCWYRIILEDLERLETLEKFVAIMLNVYKQCIDTPFYKLVNQVNPTSNFLKMVIDQELKNIKDNKDE